MPNYRRDQTPGATWFFTVVAWERQAIFCKDVFREALRQAIQKTRIRHAFCIDAWVLLPDHLHCVWTLPEDDADFSLRWKLIKQFVIRDCSNQDFAKGKLSSAKKQRRESSIWQRRFWEHKIRDEKDFANHLDYLHYNPVKHEYCKKVSAWPFSSFHHYQAAGIYPENWAESEVPCIDNKYGFGES